MPRVLGFFFDDENYQKFAAHQLTDIEIEEVLENEHLIVPNRKGRSGLFLVIGRDNGGRCIAVPIEATPYPDVWRPITAWPCKASEEARLVRQKGRPR